MYTHLTYSANLDAFVASFSSSFFILIAFQLMKLIPVFPSCAVSDIGMSRVRGANHD